MSLPPILTDCEQRTHDMAWAAMAFAAIAAEHLRWSRRSRRWFYRRHGHSDWSIDTGCVKATHLAKKLCDHMTEQAIADHDQELHVFAQRLASPWCQRALLGLASKVTALHMSDAEEARAVTISGRRRPVARRADAAFGGAITGRWGARDPAHGGDRRSVGDGG
ncbi:MAG: hypothetical protein WD042_19195, partial [Phycisphaeraceae bacterium]